MPLKTELHAHTRDDPHDRVPHSATELIDQAVALGYGALAITLHDCQRDMRELIDYAARRNLVLLRGVERTICGKHVLLINFEDQAQDVDSFEALGVLRREIPTGLVIAPHPFYPAPQCLGRQLRTHADLFDAVEVNAFYTSTTGMFNREAIRWARSHGKTLVANADIHRLWQLDKTYSLVDAEPTADAVCAAIKAGHVEIQTTPMSTLRAATHLVDMLWSGVMSG